VYDREQRGATTSNQLLANHQQVRTHNFNSLHHSKTKNRPSATNKVRFLVRFSILQEFPHWRKPLSKQVEIIKKQFILGFSILMMQY
jgi:hypothetical protein